MLLSLRKTGLTSSFKEVRVFKVFLHACRSSSVNFPWFSQGKRFKSCGKSGGGILRDVFGPTLSFLSLIFLQKGKGNHQKKKIFIPTEPLRSLEKRREKAHKKTRKSSQGDKNKEFQTKQRGQGTK